MMNKPAPDVLSQGECFRQQALLNFAFDHMTQALYLIDDQARFLHVNQESCRMLGYSCDDLLRMTVLDIDPELTPARWAEHWQQVMDTRATVLNGLHRTRDGVIFPVEISVSRFEFDGRYFILALAQDMTERQRFKEKLQRSEQEFRALAENSPDTIARYDSACRRLYCNPALASVCGVPVDLLLGNPPSALMPTASARCFEDALRAVFASGEGRQFEQTWQAPGARTQVSHFRMTPEFGPDRRVASVLCVGRDISTIKENEFRLQQAETMARIGHWHWDFAQGKSLVSAGLCHIFGRPADWRPSLTEAFDMIVTEDRDQVRSAFRAAFSRLDVEIDCGYRVNLESGVLYLHSRVCIEYAPDGRPFRLIGTAQDISELKSYESRLHEMAFHDILTGLPNRAQLNDRLSQALTDAKRHNQRLGLLVLDLDRFKEINDTHGHSMGDQVLNTVAERLRGLVRDYDTVARLGGDEFAIIFPEIREAANLGGISQKILDALARPIHLGKNNLFISASIGIAVFPSDGKTADELLQYADSALFDAKDHGRASFRFYLAELTAKSRERSMLEADLRRAEANGELELYYQPKVDLTDGSLIGAEALVRWNHPTLGLLAPDKFIGIAEDTGLIVSIGAWILSEACRTVRRWNRHNDRALKMAVNFSPRQFHGDDLVTTVCNTLAATRCEPGWLEVEITESLLLDDHSGVRATLDSFRVQGISIAIDDFGTGYSALGYLKRFPIDVLKIDRSFTSEVMQDHHSAELVKVIILMAHGMGLDVVAEGVETSEQANFLNNHGCHLGQGYLFGKPMPLAVFETHPCFVENA